METTIVLDYIENVEGINPEKVMHIEDYIETDEKNQEHILAVYSLFSADFKHKDTPSYYVQIASSSANTIIPASNDVLKELFPDYIDEN